MLALSRTVITVGAVLSLMVAGCTQDAPEVPFGPRGADDIVQHLVEAPPLPVAVAGDVALAELRSEDGTNRHQAFLGALAADATLESDFVPGSLVLVPAGASLTAPDGVSVATLTEGEVVVVTAVEDCVAPCTVAGPALIAPTGWLGGIGVTAGWTLLSPAPEA
jgi:hypothetical protein